MSPSAAMGLLALTLVFAVAGVVVWLQGYREQAALVRAETLGARGGLRRNLIVPWERRFVGTRYGARARAELRAAGVQRVLAIEAALGTVLLVLVTTWVATTLVALHWAALCGAVAALTIRAWLRRRQRQQLLRFLGQIPELARVLSNATSAGLSIRTALEMAAEELQPPAAEELAILVREIEVGTPLDEALLHLEQRLPGRELSVLVGTLIISHRAGGSLITALRHISETLEDRKELNREVRTVLTQATYTGYLVVAMGFGLLIVINSVSPGLLRLMTERIVGQVALLFAGACFGVGLLIIRRMTRIEV